MYKFIIKRILFLIPTILLAVLAALMTSCGSISALYRDPDFQKGFRAGWNSTAPEEYRY